MNFKYAAAKEKKESIWNATFTPEWRTLFHFFYVLLESKIQQHCFKSHQHKTDVI
jgi:hypothetical protein